MDGGGTGTKEKGGTGAHAREVTSRAVLTTVAVSLCVVHCAQLVAGDIAWAGVIAFAIVAAWVFGARWFVLRSVRTAVVLMITISLACVLATLTVQRPQLSGASAEDYRGTVAYAWAHLWVKASHPWPRAAELSDTQRQHQDDLEAVFGERIASEEREKTHKAALAAADQERARELAAAHPRVFAVLYRIADGLRFTDAYGAWWFACLFYLLAANLAVGAVGRRKVTLRNLGFHAAHVGLILVVAGATGSTFLARRGFVALQVDRTVDAYMSRATGQAEALGFSLRLDQFDTQYHEDLAITAGSPPAGPMGEHHGFSGGGRGVQRTEKLELGKQFALADPETGAAFELTMEEISQAAGMARTMVAVDPGTEGGVTAVELQLSKREGDSIWLRAGDPPFIDMENRYKIRVVEGPPPQDETSVTCDGVVGQGTFGLALEGAPALEPIRAVPGEVATLGPFTVEFEQVFPSFRVGIEEVDEAEFPRNPALRVHLTDRDGTGGEFLFFSEERLKDFTRLPWSGVTGSFDYDYWCSPTRVRVELSVGEDGHVNGAVLDADGTVSHGELGEGSRLAGLEPSLLRALPAAREQWQLIDDPPEGVPMQTALRLTVEGPRGRDEHWLLSNTPQGVIRLESGGQEGGLLLQLADNRDRPPRDWRSTISVLEEGRVVHGAVVEVNEPLSYGGLSFFQSDADPSRPDYSGLQVVRDPAWPLVAAGLWALLLGIAWCFYVQPVMDRRARAVRVAAKGGEG